MFVLRTEHETAFRAAGLKRFYRYAVEYIQKHYPEWTGHYRTEMLLAMFEEWYPEAQRAGFSTEYQIINYYASRLLLTQRFLWPLNAFNMSKFLDNDAATATVRSDALLAHARLAVSPIRPSEVRR